MTPPTLSLPEAKLARRIIAHSLLEIASRNDKYAGRSSAIQADEAGLLIGPNLPLFSVFDMPRELVGEAATEYLALREGRSPELEAAFREPTKSTLTMQRYGSLCRLLDAITPNVRPPTREYQTAMQSLRALEEHVAKMDMFLPGKFDIRGLDSQRIAALFTLLEAGDYGAFFGIPIDDAHTLSDRNPHPLEYTMPALARFQREVYPVMPRFTHDSGFLSCESDNDSVPDMLMAMLLNRAATVDVPTDPRTRASRQFTRQYLPELLQNIFFEFRRDNVDEAVATLWPKIAERDGYITVVVYQVLKNPEATIKSDVYEQYPELQMLLRFDKAYRQVATDGVLSLNEHSLLDRALEFAGIRTQNARHALLDVKRDEHGNLTGCSLDNLDVFFGSKFYRDHRVQE